MAFCGICGRYHEPGGSCVREEHAPPGLPGRRRPRRRMAADLRHSMKRVERTLFWVFWGVVLAVVLLIVVA